MLSFPHIRCAYAALQGGYHELVHEPDGMSERLISECIQWIEDHLPPKPEPSPVAAPAPEPAAAPAATPSPEASKL